MSLLQLFVAGLVWIGCVAWFVGWLLAPIWARARVDPQVPEAALGRRVRFRSRPPRRLMTDAETIRVFLGIVAVVLIVGGVGVALDVVQ